MDAESKVRQYVSDFYSGRNTHEMLGRLSRFYLWVESGCCMIRDATAELVPMRFRAVQFRVLAKMMKQAAAGKPVRIIVGKSRKTGISTLVQCLFVFLGSMYPLQRAVTLAHAAPATQDIFDIAVRTARKWTVRPPSEDIGGRREIFWPDIESWYRSGTAGGVAVGAGGTPSALHMSEVAKWERNKAETEYNATTAVPDNPLTIVVYESTFKARDLFWRRFDDARRGKTGYDAEFIGWWMDPTLSSEPHEPFVRSIEEKNIARLANDDGVEVSNEMLQWRRNKIAEIGAAVFRQEYPSTPEEAIQATRGLILPMMRTALVSEFPFEPHSIFERDKVGGIDFGFVDPTVIWSGYRYDDRIWLDQVWWGVETFASDQVAGLRDGTTYYCDPAGRAAREELQKAANEAGKRVKLLKAPRRKGPGEDIESVEMWRLVRAVETSRLMVMADEADDLLIETDSLSWDERTGKPDMTKTDEAHHFDRVMALKYLIMGMRRSTAATKPLARERAPSKGRSFAV